MSFPRIRPIWRTLGLFAVLVSAALGDHTANFAAGPSPVNCGFAALGQKVEPDVTSRLGKPSNISRSEAEGYPGRGTLDYEWKIRNGTKLTASVHYIGNARSAIYSVEIEGLPVRNTPPSESSLS